MKKTPVFPGSFFNEKEFITERIHFKQPRYNAETEAAIQEARDIRAGKIKAKVYHSVAEMNADIDADIDE